MLALALAGGTVALAFALRFVGVDFFHFRPLIEVWLPAAIVVAAVLGAKRLGRLGVVGAAAVVALSIGAALAVPLKSSIEKEDWRGAMGRVGGRDPAACWWSRPGGRSPPRSTTARPSRCPSRARRCREIVIISPNHIRNFDPPAGFELVEQRQIQQLEFRRYRASRPTTVEPSQLLPSEPSWVRLDRAPAEPPPYRYPI